MIRFIFTMLFVVIFLILSIPLFFIEWIIGKFNKKAKDISSLRIVQWAFKIVLWFSGTTVTVIGEENIPKDEAVLFIGNHRSYFDIVLTYSRCRNLTGYVAKKEMLKIPLLSTWMIYLHCLFLDRDDIKQGLKTILEGIEKIKNGVSICIFPEGTRNYKQEEMLPFKEGSFKMAEKSGCPIIPMVINGSAEIFEKHFPKIQKKHVVIEYCKPIYIKDLTKEEKKSIGAYTQEIIRATYEKNKTLV